MKQRLSSFDGPTAIPANLYNLDLSLAVDKYRPGVHTLKDLEPVLPVVHKRARSKPVRTRCVSMPVMSKQLPMVPLAAPPVPPKTKHKQHRAISMAVLDTLSEHSEPAQSQFAPPAPAALAPATSAAPTHSKTHSTARWSAHSDTLSSHSRDWSAHSSSGSLLLLTLYHPSARLVLLVRFSSSFQPDHCPTAPASVALSRRHSATADVLAERFALVSPESNSREELLLLLFPLLRLSLELLLLELLGILVLLLLLPLGLELDELPLQPPSFKFGAPYQSTCKSDLDASVNGKLLKVVESYLHSPLAMASDATSCYSESLFSEHEEKRTLPARGSQLLQQRQPAPQAAPLALPKTRRNRESIQSVQSAHSSQSSASLKETMQEVKQIVRQRPFSFALDSLRDYGYLRYFAPARPSVRSASAAAPHTPPQGPTEGRQNRFGDRSAYRHASAHT